MKNQKSNGSSRIFNLLLFNLALAGCGSESPRLDGPNLNASQIIQTEEKTILPNLRSLRVSCKDPMDCPSNVGVVLIMSQNPATETGPIELMRCTGFLVSDEIVATNSHCIPDWMKKAGANCADSLGIRFVGEPESNSFTCQELISFSELKPDPNAHILTDPDYAFFRIQRVNKPKLTLKHLALTDSATVEIPTFDDVTIDAESGLHSLQLLKKTCSVIYYSSLSLVVNPFAPVAPVRNCDIDVVGGNSGSPVLTSDGYVAAIVHGVTKSLPDLVTNIKEELSQRFVNIIFSDSSQVPSFAVVTNISCLSLEGVTSPHPDCALRGSEEEQRKEKSLHSKKMALDRHKEALRSASQPLIEKGFQLSLFAYLESDDRVNYLLNPDCIDPSRHTPGVFQFPTLTFQRRFQADSLFRVTNQDVLLTDGGVSFQLETTLSNSSGYEAVVRAKDPASGEWVSHTGPLPTCPGSVPFDFEIMLQEFLNTVPEEP